MARNFHITDILSITTGRLVSIRGMSGVYDILAYMTGDQVFTHQIPAARNASATALLEQHPYLAGTQCLGVDETNLSDYTEAWIDQFGEYLVVDKLSGSLHDFSDPLADLAENIHPERIFQLNLDRPDPRETKWSR